VLSHYPSHAVILSEIAELAEIDLSNLKAFSQFRLKEKFVQNYVSKITKSLEEIGFADEAQLISQSSFDGIKTLQDLHWILCKPVLEAIARRRGFDVDVDGWWRERRKFMRSKSPVQMARNYYIFDEVKMLLCKSNSINKIELKIGFSIQYFVAICFRFWVNRESPNGPTR
jgi:hypothetical protein